VHSDELKSGLNYLLGGVSGGGDSIVLKKSTNWNVAYSKSMQ